ncbi:hypothetical protein GCM10017781_20460 [Deinococcus metalli]|uniref:Uncharacterized protein n=1 Tax=Deinococcus metalli TaxID=1141878 RepID=A0ABQ3JNR6_9DEIO|nr:hypothetical protein GCM10017781_20460 [Deinococcus metalli]
MPCEKLSKGNSPALDGMVTCDTTLPAHPAADRSLPVHGAGYGASGQGDWTAAGAREAT